MPIQTEDLPAEPDQEQAWAVTLGGWAMVVDLAGPLRVVRDLPLPGGKRIAFELRYSRPPAELPNLGPLWYQETKNTEEKRDPHPLLKAESMGHNNLTGLPSGRKHG